MENNHYKINIFKSNTYFSKQVASLGDLFTLYKNVRIMKAILQ